MFTIICVVCRENFKKTDDVYTTQCGHIYHKYCITNWLTDNRTCPQCRKTCERNSIRKLYLESATESSVGDEDNEGRQRSLNIQSQPVDLQNLEKVNLNLRRKLQTAESDLGECFAKLLTLEEEHKKVKNDLKKKEEEIAEREFVEMFNKPSESYLREESENVKDLRRFFVGSNHHPEYEPCGHCAACINDRYTYTVNHSHFFEF